jgi:hypothetical protein
MFSERYVSALQSSDLRDDPHHVSTEALFAAAIASKTGAGLGALLSRVKYSDGTLSKDFQPGSNNLVRLLAIWQDCIRIKSGRRNWVPTAGSEWTIQAHETLYRRVAMGSLAHWIDGRCSECSGAGQTPNRRLCPACKGSGRAEIAPGATRLEQQLIADMVSDLEGMVQAHDARAAGIMRRPPA